MKSSMRWLSFPDKLINLFFLRQAAPSSTYVVVNRFIAQISIYKFSIDFLTFQLNLTVETTGSSHYKSHKKSITDASDKQLPNSQTGSK